MPSVLESVTGLLAQGDTLSKLGGALGTDTGNTTKALEAATPGLLGGMADRVEQPGGLSAMTKMLNMAEGSRQSGIDGMFSGDSQMGSGMLASVFGSGLSGTVSSLASKAGVSSTMMGKLLPMIAPLVMGVLAKRRATDGLSESGIGDLLVNERSEMMRSGLLGAGVAGAGVAGAGALGAKAGRTADRAGTAVRDRADAALPAKPSGRGFGWLKWLIGAVLLVVLAGWALSQCGDSDELSSTTGALGDAVDDAGDVVDDATDAAGDAVDEATDVAGDAVDEATDAAGDVVDEATEALEGADLQPDVDAALAGAGVVGIAGTVEDGVVSLTGEVESDTAKAAAEAAVSSIEGVTSVDNQIVVAPAEETETEAPAAGSTINDLLDLDPITFAVNSAEITDDGKAVLVSAVEFMTANPGVEVEIGGHTDSDGNDAFNQELSQARAESVKALLESEGVDGNRMSTKGYGEAQPKVDNDTDENKAINRRIEFTIQ